ncbi:MAG: type II toxin-antitoxin system RelB/DinJ family antitoxin [Ruminococcus sp.]|nr:type II toxin-antitoxin system RelB/DinJ family antitoxin [Ruminococcus sp.]
MSTSVIQVRVDDELKAQAGAVFDELGLDFSTAFRLFLKKCVTVNGIPFMLINERNRDNSQPATADDMSYEQQLRLIEQSEDDIRNGRYSPVSEAFASMRKEFGI